LAGGCPSAHFIIPTRHLSCGCLSSFEHYRRSALMRMLRSRLLRGLFNHKVCVLLDFQEALCIQSALCDCTEWRLKHSTRQLDTLVPKARVVDVKTTIYIPILACRVVLFWVSYPCATHVAFPCTGDCAHEAASWQVRNMSLLFHACRSA
jgi:hypothetical protein